jgi:hypothetical protein
MIQEPRVLSEEPRQRTILLGFLPCLQCATGLGVVSSANDRGLGRAFAKKR